MTFRQPLIHRWRQQKPRVTVYLPKVAHPPNCPGIPSFQSYHIMRHLPPKSDRLLGAGDPAPTFMLPDPDDVMISSAELLENGPLVVTFYRGIWCPYCRQ